MENQDYLAYFAELSSRTSSVSSNSTPEKPRLSFGIDAILSPNFGKRSFSDHSRSSSPILEPMSLAAQLLAATIEKPKVSQSRGRTIFTEEQLEELEIAFARNQYVIGNERVELANSLGLGVKQVKIWFQNRRIKHRRSRKRMQTSDSE